MAGQADMQLECKAMMAKKQDMHAKMQAMDATLEQSWWRR